MPRAESAAAPGGEVSIEWRVPKPQQQAVQKRLGPSVVTTPEPTGDRASSLFFIVAGLVSLPSVAEAVAATYRDFVFGGVIIDACGEKLKIRNDHALPGGMVVVRCGQNVEIYRSSDVKAPELAKAIIDAGAKE